MIRKKNSFLTFCFSMLPGAGQMYMGFMKRGLSLMFAFFISITLTAWLQILPIIFIIPIIWFYSFFDVFNLRGMPDDEFYALEDDYILYPEITKEKARIFQSKYRNVFAIALIVIGISVLWNNIFDMFRWYMPDVVYRVIDRFGNLFPSMCISFAIIALGIYLIRGKKKELDSADNQSDNLKFLEDKRGNEQ